MNQNQSKGNQPCCQGGRRFSSTRESIHPIHRIATVMKQEGITARILARRLDTTEAAVIKESHPTCDMLLSELYRWQTALRVPVADLLAEPDIAFSPAVLLRTRLLKLMRSVRSIQEHSTEEPIQTFARELSEQLMKIMPELENVTSWPTTGQRREPHELGAVASNVIPSQLFNNISEDV